MLLVTLEGLPHAGRACVLRQLMHLRPGWAAINVSPDPATACAWASAECRASHAQFASLMRKLHCLSRCGPEARVVLLSSPWFEHLTCHPAVRALAAELTAELVARLGCRVRKHLMVMLDVPHDETFEQMVCCGNPSWNATSLADLRGAHTAIARGMHVARDGGGAHPFPCETCTVHCPAFFDENEVVARGITRTIVAAVERAAAVD